MDRLLWIRKAHLHRVAPFTVSCYERWTGKLLSNNGINSNGFTEHHVTLLYEIYEHFGKEIHSDFSERQLENIHYYTGYVRSFLELYGNQLAVLGTESERLRLGVTKLNQVSTQVSTLKNDAFEQKQLLDAKRLEADEAFNLIMNSMHESEDKKGELEEIQKRIEVETVTLNGMACNWFAFCLLVWFDYLNCFRTQKQNIHRAGTNRAGVEGCQSGHRRNTLGCASRDSIATGATRSDSRYSGGCATSDGRK